MNSEELEVSLRTEFENHLKSVFAEMRQEISQLQEKIEAELDNHKRQLGEVFSQALARREQEASLDAGFTESVVEHMRLARDEGARITATAIAEAEEMQRQAAPAVGIKELHEAVKDISAKSSQAEILKTLVQHAGQFTPRGAFFIVKNEHFVGWRTFGGERGDSDETIREVFMPMTADSLLSESARSLVTVESSYGTFSDDAETLEKIGFDGSPEKMYAIPLIVRSRAVAVLYADYGTQGAEVNAEALETMVRVAGLTVEVLASAKGAPASREGRRKPAKAFAAEGYAPVEQEAKESAQPEYAAAPTYAAPVSEPAYKPSFESESFSQPGFQEEPAERYSDFEYKPEARGGEITDYASQPAQDASSSYAARQERETSPESPESYSAYEKSVWNDAPVETVTEIDAADYAAEIDADEFAQPNYSTESSANQYDQPDYSAESKTDDYSPNFAFQPSVTTETESNAAVSGDSASEYQATNEYRYENNQSFEPSKVESFESFEPVKTENLESFSAPAPQSEMYAPAAEEKSGAFETIESVPETAFVESAPAAAPAQSAAPVKSRFSERNVDLPIEVSEDERRLHNDARRFARLLVSEIKLYNEQKVKEGRESNDLYDRLREAVDRSREMYDKRVQSPVAAKFDYFHYELVNTLAEGDDNKLGRDYPGATV